MAKLSASKALHAQVWCQVFMYLMCVISTTVAGTAYITKPAGIDFECTPPNIGDTMITCSGQQKSIASHSFRTGTGSLRSRMLHCQDFANSFSHTWAVTTTGYGLGYCIPTGSEWCMSYDFCSYTIPVENKLGVGHYDLGEYYLVLEETTIDAFSFQVKTSAALIRKDSLFRMCPSRIRPSTYYTNPSESTCTYNYENSNSVFYIELPETARAVRKGILTAYTIQNGEWLNRYTLGGVAAAEGYAHDLILEFEADGLSRRLSVILSQLSAHERTLKHLNDTTETNTNELGRRHDPFQGFGADNTLIRSLFYGAGRALVATVVLLILVLLGITCIGGPILFIIGRVRSGWAEHADRQDVVANVGNGII